MNGLLQHACLDVGVLAFVAGTVVVVGGFDVFTLAGKEK